MVTNNFGRRPAKIYTLHPGWRSGVRRKVKECSQCEDGGGEGKGPENLLFPLVAAMELWDLHFWRRRTWSSLPVPWPIRYRPHNDQSSLGQTKTSLVHTTPQLYFSQNGRTTLRHGVRVRRRIPSPAPKDAHPRRRDVLQPECLPR